MYFPVELHDSIGFSCLSPHNLKICLKVDYMTITDYTCFNPPHVTHVHAALLPGSFQILSRPKSCIAHPWVKEFSGP